MSSVFFWHNLSSQPIAFYLGSWSVYYYGIILAVAFLAGYLLAERRAKKMGFVEGDWQKMFWAVFLSGAIGARVWDWFFYENFSALPWWEIFNIRGGGLAIHGFILGALLGLILLRLLNSKFQIPNSI